MTDQATTGTPTAATSGTPLTGQPTTTAQPPSQTRDWEASYKGMVKANSDKDQQIQVLAARVTEKEQQIAQLLGEKDTQKATWETKLKEANQAFLKLKQQADSASQDHTTAVAELAKLRALSNHPDLMGYADLIQPTNVQAELEAQIARVQQIHAGTVEAARKGLQQQGFAPPAAPPATPPGAVTEASLEKELKEIETEHAMGRITQAQYFKRSAEIGAQYNLLQQGK